MNPYDEIVDPVDEITVTPKMELVYVRDYSEQSWIVC